MGVQWRRRNEPYVLVPERQAGESAGVGRRRGYPVSHRRTEAIAPLRPRIFARYLEFSRRGGVARSRSRAPGQRAGAAQCGRLCGASHAFCAIFAPALHLLCTSLAPLLLHAAFSFRYTQLPSAHQSGSRNEQYMHKGGQLPGAHRTLEGYERDQRPCCCCCISLNASQIK